MKILSAILFAAIGLSAMSLSSAQEASTAKKHPIKKTAAKKTATHKNATTVDEDDKEPDVGADASTEYDCELGNKLTIYRNVSDNEHIALRWKKRLLRLNRIQTTTGANRFENKKNGWVWIDIPTKGMLLDAKKGQQLANECKNPEQLKATADATKS